MVLIVTKGFIDKNTKIFHNVGDKVEYPEARAKEIEYCGFGKCVVEKKPAKVAAKAEKVVEPEETPFETKKADEQPKKVNRKK